MNPPEKEKKEKKDMEPILYEPHPNMNEILPSELREKWRNATKKEKNDIMRFYYEYVI